MAGSHRHALAAVTGSQLLGTEALSVVHCLEAKVPWSLSLRLFPFTGGYG